MDIYPAIDLRSGQVVRLKYGDPNQQTVFDADPLTVARRWADAGAAWLHVVNLDGAFGDDAGAAAKNRALLKPLCETGLYVQFGGGVRSMADIEAVLALGVTRVILGTIAIEQPDIVREAVERWGADRIVVGLDAREGRIKTRGWQVDGGINTISIGRQLRSSGVAIVIHTDIGRDGVLSGVNAAASIEVARETGLRVIASGGVSSIEDVIGLKNQPEIEGVIIGRALYTGAIDLRDLLIQLR
ncbi:MAG TPA: 1-(5-phosphoribosyl)-5-[(5-phosphoribosylamino)methylideneamino]imidazole-4-carboxamide isomerase [Anaerolineae bacterium]|nr:1-(5-phosphoribosyl)-5-[(5-phosphoribosylamino)methylideneamino]imidazole-4-carboxamide isomerase [Anaerolineae bacterium]